VELKPTDLILALMQFLEILVPGAFVSFLMKDFADKHIFGMGLILPKVFGDAQRWVGRDTATAYGILPGAVGNRYPVAGLPPI
jgi:hypothetical protein